LCHAHARECAERIEVTKRTPRAAQHYSLRLARNSAKPAALHDLSATGEAYLLRVIIALHRTRLLIIGRLFPGLPRAERVELN